jgi:acyl carrier protein
MDHEKIIYSIIGSLLAQQGREGVRITNESAIHDDGLGFDSLTTAEFSARLEDALGHDPYTAGTFPPTVGDLLAFYR